MISRGNPLFFRTFPRLINTRTFASFVLHALKGQKPLAQGSALGNYGCKPVAL